MRGAYPEAIEGYRIGTELDGSPSSRIQVLLDLETALERSDQNE